MAAAIRSQNLDAPAGQIGQPPSPEPQPFQLPIDTLGRLTDPEQFGDIIVKVGPDPAEVRRKGQLRDAPAHRTDAATACPAGGSATRSQTRRHDQSADQQRRRPARTTSDGTTGHA